MKYCPNCSNILDTIKSSINIQEKKIVKKFIDIVKLIENNEDLSNYKAEFKLIDILDNKKYIKYPDDIKKKINTLFENTNQSNYNAEYKCFYCGYIKPINETIRLYINNIDNDDIIFQIKSLEENELLCNDPLLPHTRDYICKNPNCLTHIQSDLKDSIFYKDKNNYKVIYICCVCFHNW